MALESGSRLGAYEILSAIGAGGMGEVYRARDSKLGREVAIKVLPEEFTQHPQKLARFEREARLLASLNHPGIATLYEVEESEGKPFLVMELVEGETLAERIGRGPIPVNEALTLAQQIAEALEAAHEKGVIHRDLKPANIKVDPEGHVKVLDFGLAKAFADEVPESELSASPTLSRDATKAGVILGTAAYMSPEQAKGKTVDKRSDIFSFGIVLYEMLTGKRAFAGEDVSEVLARILASEPDWKALSPNIPPSLVKLLGRCLSKDRKNRLRDIGDARFEIQEILTAPRATSETVKARAPVLAWGLAVLVAALVGGIIVWSLTRPAPPRLARFAISEPPNVFINPGFTPTVTISPDGTRIVYVGPGEQLYVRAVDQLEAVALRGGVGRNPFISPDGNWVGFRSEGDNLEKVSIHGGPPVVLSEGLGGIAGASWGADDRIIFGTEATNGLFRVSAAGGGEREPLTTLEEGESGHLWPEILPGGRTVVFTVEKGQANFEIAALNLETGERKLLIPGGSNPHYAATGHIVYGIEGTLRAVPFDLDALEVKGDPIPVLEGVVTQVRGDAHFSLAEDGTLAYVPGTGSFSQQLTFVWVDREGHEEPVAAEPRAYQEFTLSPDGSQIAVRVRIDNSDDVWIYDLGRDTTTRLTFDPAGERYPVWTPDGQKVAFGYVGGALPMSWKAADGTGEVEPLGENSTYHVPEAFSPDGTVLVFEERVGTDLAISRLGMLSLEGERAPTLLLDTEFSERNATLSPDGRWMAYESDESGQFEVYVRPFPDVNAGRWQVSNDGGTWPLWAPDGRELFYVGPQAMMSVAVETEPTFALGTRESLFDMALYRRLINRRVAISPDSQQFLLLKEGGESEDTAAPPSIVVVQNWFEELKQLAPSN